MKNVRVKVKVREFYDGNSYDFGIFEGKKILMDNINTIWQRKSAAIRNAKATAKRIGIPFDPEIIKEYGC